MGVFRGSTKLKLFQGWTKVKKAYLGATKLYAAGNIVTYYVDGALYFQEEVDSDASCLAPTTFTPSKSGWEFVGWREDTTASGEVLGSKNMGDEPVALYAVFSQNITLSYNGNGATGGSISDQTGTRYYNNGNIVNPTFTLASNGFSRTDYAFKKWALGSESGVQYSAGTEIAIGENSIMYAVWDQVRLNILSSSGVTWTAGISSVSCASMGANDKDSITSKSSAINVSKFKTLKWVGSASAAANYGGGTVILRGGISSGAGDVFEFVLGSDAWLGVKTTFNKSVDISSVNTLYLSVYVATYTNTDASTAQYCNTSSLVAEI